MTANIENLFCFALDATSKIGRSRGIVGDWVPEVAWDGSNTVWRAVQNGIWVDCGVFQGSSEVVLVAVGSFGDGRAVSAMRVGETGESVERVISRISVDSVWISGVRGGDWNFARFFYRFNFGTEDGAEKNRQDNL
ncbi:hypothetical protein PPYR_09155 [Photinus pyralis]|uniref:Uncharacterized protein n=1 Tax=Photinus pyralis TaxID=7054 RepID=A0A5N4ALE4_PHOPY|nr:hypothetical protein PPYR_09155 [Photinus pyralis]